MTLAPIGIVAGLIGAVSLTRVMATLLFGVSATACYTPHERLVHPRGPIYDPHGLP